MANILSINCSVDGGYGQLAVLILHDEGIITNVFKSPSVFSFTRDVGEILNWHKDNILSLISSYKIDAIVVKKSERVSIRGTNSDIFKMYLEGVMLSLAGTLGIQNAHFEKTNVKAILKEENIFDMSLTDILTKYDIELDTMPTNKEGRNTIKNVLLAALAFNTQLEL